MCPSAVALEYYDSEMGDVEGREVFSLESGKHMVGTCSRDELPLALGSALATCRNVEVSATMAGGAYDMKVSGVVSFVRAVAAGVVLGEEFGSRSDYDVTSVPIIAGGHGYYASSGILAQTAMKIAVYRIFMEDAWPVKTHVDLGAKDYTSAIIAQALCADYEPSEQFPRPPFGYEKCFDLDILDVTSVANHILATPKGVLVTAFDTCLEQETVLRAFKSIVDKVRLSRDGGGIAFAWNEPSVRAIGPDLPKGPHYDRGKLIEGAYSPFNCIDTRGVHVYVSPRDVIEAAAVVGTQLTFSDWNDVMDYNSRRRVKLAFF
jgi:hypothetical protein